MVGKTSKKGWRNIKLTEELSTLAHNEQSAELGAKVDTLFIEDTTGSSKGVSKVVEKVVKLQNAKGKTAVSLSEAQLLNRTIAKAGKRPQQPKSQKKGKLCDLWASDESSKKMKLLPSSVVRRESFVPAVVPAGPGLSVNPSEEQFNAMLIEEAQKEIALTTPAKPRTVPAAESASQIEQPETATAAEQGILIGSKVTERKKKAQKLKERKHKQMLREHEQRRQEKEARKALMNKVALREAEAERELRRGQRFTTRVQRVLEEAAGKVTIRRGAGGRLAPVKEQIPTEISSSLRRVLPGDAVMDRRASLLKRRLIEQVPEINAEYKEKIRYAKHVSGKSRKLVDSDAKARCVLLG